MEKMYYMARPKSNSSQALLAGVKNKILWVCAQTGMTLHSALESGKTKTELTQSNRCCIRTEEANKEEIPPPFSGQ